MFLWFAVYFCTQTIKTAIKSVNFFCLHNWLLFWSILSFLYFERPETEEEGLRTSCSSKNDVKFALNLVCCVHMPGTTMATGGSSLQTFSWCLTAILSPNDLVLVFWFGHFIRESELSFRTLRIGCLVFFFFFDSFLKKWMKTCAIFQELMVFRYWTLCAFVCALQHRSVFSRLTNLLHHPKSLKGFIGWSHLIVCLDHDSAPQLWLDLFFFLKITNTHTNEFERCKLPIIVIIGTLSVARQTRWPDWIHFIN